MRGLWHQLVRLHHREVGEPAEVGLVAPDALVGAEHRVVVCARVLIVDVVAVDGHAVAGFPRAHRIADTQHHTGAVAADHVIRQVVALGPRTLAREPSERAERADRFENRAPHRVEIDAARHHRHKCLVGGDVGQRHLAQLEAAARVFVARGDAGEHLGVFLLEDRRAVGDRQRERRELLAGSAVVDGVSDQIHA